MLLHTLAMLSPLSKGAGVSGSTDTPPPEASDVKMWRAGCSVSCIRKREYQRSLKSETVVGKIVTERAEKTGQKAPKNPEMRN